MSEEELAELRAALCVFCQRIRSGETTEIHKSGVHHFEPLNPVTPGHRLFISREHIDTENLNLMSGLMGLVFSKATEYAETRGDVDYNLILNRGKNASQTIPHRHLHYVPRSPEDGLHLPWTDQVKSGVGGLKRAMVDHLKNEGIRRDVSDAFFTPSQDGYIPVFGKD